MVTPLKGCLLETRLYILVYTYTYIYIYIYIYRINQENCILVETIMRSIIIITIIMYMYMITYIDIIYRDFIDRVGMK